MQIDFYHLYRQLHFANFAHPITLEVLRVWAESAGWNVRIAASRETAVDLETEADVVGFSVYTQTAPAVYRLSRKLREKGKIVILGGPHFRGPATFHEAQTCCDIIVRSINEDQMKRLLNDISSGYIRQNGRDALIVSDDREQFRYPDHFYQGFTSQKWYQFASIPTSIGCPYDCEFCSPYMKGRYVLREIDTIYSEMEHINGKCVFICDATFGLNKKFTIGLMNTIAPLNKTILIETSPARLRDKDVLIAMARGGVRWIVMGIETLSHKMKKHGTAGLDACLNEIVDHAHDLGMIVQGNVICGLDSDGPESFDHLYQMYEKSNIDLLMAGIVTPYPNTRLYDELYRDGRIIDSNWEHYDCQHIVYRPLGMTVDQLIEGYLHLCSSISSKRSILKKAAGLIAQGSFNIESMVMLMYKTYNWYDFTRKQRIFSDNRDHLNRLRTN